MLLWGGAAVLLLLGLVAAFLYVLTQRHDLTRYFRQADDWLLRHAPSAWRPVRDWLARDVARTVTLLGSVAFFVGAVYVFTVIAESWMDEEVLYRLDQSVHAALDGNTSAALIRFMYTATYLGDALTMLAVAAAAGLFLWARNAYRQIGTMVLTLGGGQVVVYALKRAFARSRPEGGLTDPFGSSFPSGHTFTATILYGFLIVLAWQFIPRRNLRVLASLVLAAFILTAGVSRVVIGVHWVSDVFGGWTIGLAWLTCTLFASWMWRRTALWSR